MDDRTLNIALVGIDGSGKSSFVSALIKRLNEQGIDARLSDWFRGTPFKELAAKFNENESMSAEVLAALHAGATHWLHLNSHDAQVVIWDRCMFSSYASCVIRGASKELMRSLVEFCPTPDWTIFLRSDASICFERVEKRGGPRFYESGCDRLFSKYTKHGSALFETGQLSKVLVKEVFLLQMNQWNELLLEIMESYNNTTIENFNLNDLEEHLDNTVKEIRRLMK